MRIETQSPFIYADEQQLRAPFCAPLFRYKAPVRTSWHIPYNNAGTKTPRAECWFSVDSNPLTSSDVRRLLLKFTPVGLPGVHLAKLWGTSD